MDHPKLIHWLFGSLILSINSLSVEIVKSHRSAFHRLVHEALEIRRGGDSLLNRKEEYCRNLLPNLQLEYPQSKKQQVKEPETLPWYVDGGVDKADRKSRVPEPLGTPPKKLKTPQGVVGLGGAEPSTGSSSKNQRQTQITAYLMAAKQSQVEVGQVQAMDHQREYEVEVVKQESER